MYILFIELLLHHGKYIKLVKPKLLLPPANEIWSKVMFSQVFVCPQGGEVKGGVVKGVWQTPPSDPEADIPWTQRQTTPPDRDSQ